MKKIKRRRKKATCGIQPLRYLSSFSLKAPSSISFSLSNNTRKVCTLTFIDSIVLFLDKSSLCNSVVSYLIISHRRHQNSEIPINVITFFGHIVRVTIHNDWMLTNMFSIYLASRIREF